MIQLVRPGEISLSTILQIKNTKNSLWDTEYNPNWFVIGYDIENRGDFPKKENLLLSAFCLNDDPGEEEVLVIDNTSVDNSEIFTPDVLRHCLFVSHNADHEAMWGHVTGFNPGRYVCTMVNDKRLLAGQEGFRFDLVSVINRRLGYHAIPIWMDKDIRSEFATCTYFEDYHILYNAADTIRLKSVYYEQRRQAATYNQLFQNESINSRIILPIAEAETTGIKHDTEKWREIAKDRETKAQEICQSLDNLIKDQYGVDASQINPVLKKKLESKVKREERNNIRLGKLQLQLENLQERGKTHLKSYQLTLEQLQKLSTIMQEPEETDTGMINWGSQKQVLEVLKRVGCPMPQSKDQKTHSMKPGVGKEARTNWFVNNPSSEFMPLLENFDKYKKLIHNVTSFGEKWIEQYVQPDGRVYTRLDQAGAGTGRFTSGSKGKVKKNPNMQQVPKPQEYRGCFIADEGRTMFTLDYSNCEGMVMTSLSNDLNMMKILSIPDSHSYLGTKCWRNIYAYRYSKTGDPKWKELSETYEMNKSTPEKEKERDKFKNSGGLFPVAYGIASGKVAATAKITLDEGQVMIDTIKAEIPKVIEFLDGKAREATTKGYVVHNNRTGSRRWFDAVLNHNHYGWPLDKSALAEIEFAARNSPIQGTNSDLMKEAIAMIDLWRRLYKVDVRFLLTVHDEYVCDVPTEQAEILAPKIKNLMERAANNYLIKELKMGVDMRIAQHWKK
jgi:hypothetical protein